MSEPFLAEIKIVGFTFAPRGYALCDGQLLPISQNQALFALLGTTYGGDGRTTFALPDLRGRVPVHEGDGYSLGIRSGQEGIALSLNELPAHLHRAEASNSDATQNAPQGNVWAAKRSGTNYGTAPPNTALSPESISTVGGGQPHNNMQPYLVLNFVIALQGLFPSRN
jgi:microcystin-dependent protein